MEEKKEEKTKGIKDKIPNMIGMIGGTISIITAIALPASNFGGMRESIKSLEKSIVDSKEAENTRIDDMIAANNARFDSLEKEVESIDAKYENLFGDFQKAKGILALPLKASGVLANNVKRMSFEKNDEVYFGDLDLRDGVIAVGLDSTEYTTEELQNQSVIMAYTENGQEVFFVGQFNENNRWDGECLINAYKEGTLTIATKAIYEDGRRIDYEQVYPDEGQWIYAVRKENGTQNDGDTWKYAWNGQVKQEASIGNPSSADIYEPAEIRNDISEIPVSHYHGSTSGGLYNDDTGEAYNISYFGDGTTNVRTLYKGKFKDGYYDDSGNGAISWYITRERPNEKGEGGTYYMYYTGRFQDGHPIDERKRTSTDIFKPDITREFADDIISGEEFENEIVWDEDGFKNEN